MHRLIAFALAILCALPSFAQENTFAAPSSAAIGPSLDQYVRTLAQSVIPVYRDDDRARYLGSLFRLQSAAGQYQASRESIDALRKLRGDDTSQPPLFLQYEIYARAKEAQASRALSFENAWREAFSQRFAELANAAALRAEFGFTGGVPRMRSELESALTKAHGQTRVSLADALQLVRAWQVYSAYSEFQPLFRSALAADDARRYDVERDRLVRTPDGAQISTLVVRPRNAATLPTLFSFTIYANDDWSWGDAKAAAAHGYAGVVSYTRGKGRSPDPIIPFDHDGADATAVIDWIAAQPWSDGRVGMFGGSYVGFTQWAALKHMPKALKAIAPSATVAPGIDVPREGGVFLNFMYPWPFYVTNNRSLDDDTYGQQARWSKLNRDWYASGRAYRDLPIIDGSPNPLFRSWLHHPRYDRYWQSLIPQGKAFANIDIPVLATTGYFDGGQIGALHYLREHLRHRPNANHTFVIGPYEHFTMQTGVPPVVQGYQVDPVARVDLQALRLAWFDHVLKGAPKPELLKDRINWQVMGTNRWRHAPTIEAMSPKKERFFLTPGATSVTNILSRQPAPRKSSKQRVDFRDRSGADWKAAETVRYNTLDPRAGLVYASEPFERDAELSGEFSGQLNFTMNKRDVDVALTVYELNARGEYLELAWWIQRASYGKDRSVRQLLRPGVPHLLAIKDTRLLGRKFDAGSRIVVTLGVINQPDRQLNLGSGKDPSDETIRDAGAPLVITWRGDSFLDLPLREASTPKQ